MLRQFISWSERSVSKAEQNVDHASLASHSLVRQQAAEKATPSQQPISVRAGSFSILKALGSTVGDLVAEFIATALVEDHVSRSEPLLPNAFPNGLRAQARECSSLVNTKNSGLCKSIESGEIRLARVLLTLRADANCSIGSKQLRPLHIAAVKGHVSIINMLVLHGAKIDAGDNTDWTPLHYACQEEKIEAAAALLALGASVNARTTVGVTPLMVAVQANNALLMELLVGGGCDVHAVSQSGFTALHYSAQDSKHISTELLLVNDAVVDAKDEEGRTPLLIAVAKANLETMRILLNYGAKIDAKDHKGIRPIDVAIVADDAEKAVLLIEHGGRENMTNDESYLMQCVKIQALTSVRFCLEIGCDVNEQDEEGRTAMHFAAETGNIEIGRELLNGGAEIDSCRDYTPLHTALFCGNASFADFLVISGACVNAIGERIVGCMHAIGGCTTASYETLTRAIRMLIRNGVSINQKTDRGETALHAAVLCGNSDTIRALITMGAAVDVRDNQGETALHWACKEGALEAAKYLIDFGAAAKAIQSKDGSHPLYLAAQNGHQQLVEYLILRNAPIDLTGNQGVTPLRAAVNQNHPEIVKVLLAANARTNIVANDGQTVLIAAVSANGVDILKMLLDAGADVNQRGDCLLTPLYIGCLSNHIDAVEMMLRYGPNVNCQCGDSTPLMAAIQSDNASLVRLLLDRGASPSGIVPFSQAEQTPLHAAIRLKNANIVKLLLKCGADVHKKSDGTTPLLTAVDIEHFPIVKLLMSKGADPFAKTNDGRSAFDLALQRGHRGILDVFKAASGDKTPTRNEDPFDKSVSLEPDPLSVRSQSTFTNPFLKSETPQKVETEGTTREAEPVLFCPITLEIMTDPVVAGDGYTYERQVIIDWIQERGISPMTMQSLSVDFLVPNRSVKYQIDEHRRKHGGH